MATKLLASLGTTATGTPSSTTYLRGDNTWGAVSSDYVLLATTTASASSSISFDGYFSSTYTNYKIIANDVFSSTNGARFYVRLRRSNTDITSSDYNWVYGLFYQTGSGSGTGSDSGGFNDSKGYVVQGGVYNSATYPISFEANIINPLGTSAYKTINGNYFQPFEYSLGLEAVGMFGLVSKSATTAISGVTFYMSAGNISGTFKLYGLK